MPDRPPNIARLASLTPELASEVIRIRARGRTSPAWGVGQVIVSFIAGGRRIVAIDDDYYSLNLAIFAHDFMLQFMKDKLGPEWGNAELKKPYADRHPVLQWHEDNKIAWQRRRADLPDGVLVRADPTGPMAALYGLAFDLFTVANNSLLDNKLLQRLRHNHQFQGARYELYVRAFMLRAGFHIELEDEGRRNGKHFEFTATSKQSGHRFSVEAKSRHRRGVLGYPGQPDSEDSICVDFGHLLSDALAKPARNSRLVFIDVNVPPSDAGQVVPHWYDRLNRIISSKEWQKLEIGSKLPSCYLVITNRPHHYGVAEKEAPMSRVVITGFNIPEYRKLTWEQLRLRHPVVGEIADAAQLEGQIPAIFPDQ